MPWHEPTTSREPRPRRPQTPPQQPRCSRPLSSSGSSSRIRAWAGAGCGVP